MKLRIAIALALLATPALADDRGKPESFELRDPKGERQGRAIPRVTDRKTYDLYDELGRRQGTATREGLHRDWIVRDPTGNRTGRIIERQR